MKSKTPLSPALFSSKTDRWATPQKVFDQLNAKYGPFTLDAAADCDNAKCSQFLSKEVNGLLQPWAQLAAGGAVWLNPPYGKTIGLWVAKAREEADKGVTVVLLLPARTCTRWWHEYIWDGMHPRANTIVQLLKGRLKFGDSKSCAPFPSAVVIFHPPAKDRTIS